MDETTEQKKSLPLQTVMIGAICLLVIVVMAIVLLRPPASSTVNAQDLNVYDDHGCYNSGGYAWCAAKDKCIKMTAENCTKNDVSAQMCAQGAAANVTEKYEYDNITNTCIIKGNSNTTTIWGVFCEGNTAKASIEIRNSDVNSTQLQQIFTGCTIAKKGG